MAFHPHQAIYAPLIDSVRNLARLMVSRNGTIERVYFKSDNINSNGNAVFDIRLNGDSIYAAPEDRPVILINTKPVLQVDLGIAVVTGDILTYHIVNVPVGGIGGRLYMQVEVDDGIPTAGPPGANGIGLPPGGTTGQVPKKLSNDDYDIVWDDESGGTGGGWDGGKPSSNQFSKMYLREDFISSGDVNQSASFVGLYFLHTASFGSGAFIPSESNHPGIFRFTTSNSSWHGLRLGRAIAGDFRIKPDAYFEANFIFRVNRDGGENYFRAGLGSYTSGSNLTSLNHGFYFEQKAADGTTVYAVCNNGGTETRTSLGTTITNNTWYKFRVRRISASEIGFTVNDGTEVVISTNITTQVLDVFAILQSTTGTIKTMDIDFIDLEISGLTRY